MHTQLPAAGAFAYFPPLPSAEGLAYLEKLQPVVDLRAHGPVVIAQPPELSTNKSGRISSNLIKIDNYDEMVTCNGEFVTRDDQTRHCDITPRPEIGLSMTWHNMAVAWHDKNRRQRGLLMSTFSIKDFGMTWVMQKETVKALAGNGLSEVELRSRSPSLNLNISAPLCAIL